MDASTDTAKGANHASDKYWQQIENKFNKLAARSNSIDERAEGYTPIGQCTMGSLRTCWSKRVQPALQHFAGICLTNKPTSGEVEDDVKMNLYWS